MLNFMNLDSQIAGCPSAIVPTSGIEELMLIGNEIWPLDTRQSVDHDIR